MRPEPTAAALAIWRERYAGARVLFLAGSVLRGEATPTSDLDIVVVYEHLSRAFREAFVHAGWPVEAFVHDPQTLAQLCESDRRRGIPSLINMIIEGIEIPAESDFSARLKQRASELLACGPPPWEADELALRRYRLTDWVDDLRFSRSPEEMVATGAYLYQDVADFYFRTRGQWSAHSKTIPRRLRQTDPAFAVKFASAFDALFAERRVEPVVSLVAEVLEPFGGFFFEGFRQEVKVRES